MPQAFINLYSVRVALRASCLEIYEKKVNGVRRRCAGVGRYMMDRAIPTVTVATSRTPEFIRAFRLAA